MLWPKGTIVEHEFMGTYIIDGPIFVNEIGYTIVPVKDQKGIIHYFNPKSLKASRCTDNAGNGGIFRTPVKARFPLAGESLSKKAG